MYNDFYRFREAPFNITPDPRFLFFSDKHREAFNHILFGIRERKGFIQITGEVGAGKTTVCRAILGELPSHCRTALILNPILTSTQLVRAILVELGEKPKKVDRAGYLERLNAYLLDQATQGNDVVLFIDEAQDLGAELLEEVRLLSNLETDQRKLLQIVLIGQPELREKLNERGLRQLRQRITVRYHLTPLSRDETERYIAHRLRVAGATDGRPTFHALGDLGDSPVLAGRAAADQRDLRQGSSLRIRERDRSLDGPAHPARRQGARGTGRVSLIDEALKRAQATDKVAEDRPSTWTPTHLPDRRPRTYRVVGIAAGLVGMALLSLWIWKENPKKEAAVREAAVKTAAPIPPVADIPAGETVEVAPPPRGIPEPRNSARVAPDRPLSDRGPGRVTSPRSRAGRTSAPVETGRGDARDAGQARGQHTRRR